MILGSAKVRYCWFSVSGSRGVLDVPVTTYSVLMNTHTLFSVDGGRQTVFLSIRKDIHIVSFSNASAVRTLPLVRMETIYTKAAGRSGVGSGNECVLSEYAIFTVQLIQGSPALLCDSEVHPMFACHPCWAGVRWPRQHSIHAALGAGAVPGAIHPERQASAVLLGHGSLRQLCAARHLRQGKLQSEFPGACLATPTVEPFSPSTHAGAFLP